MSKKTAVLSLHVIVSVLLLSGCLMTIGAPLAKRIKPNSWTFEGAFSIMNPFEQTPPGSAAYFYAGHSLGKHFEIGVLPFFYFTNTTGILSNITSSAIALPIKWDPFDYESPFHLSLYAAPCWYTGDIEGFLLYEGLGLSYYFPFPLEIYASYSIPYYGFQLFTLSVGSRYYITPHLAVGTNFTLVEPLAYGFTLSLTTMLGP